MATKPDGKAAGAAQRVTFTRPAAERIAKAVRTVEGGNRSSSALEFGAAPGAVPPKNVRIATFTGTWSISASKSVTLKYQATTPNTVSVTNLLFQWPGSGTYDCAIAKDGTAWFLVGVPLETSSASFLSGVSVAASLNTSNCAITVTKTETTGSATFVRFKV